MHIHLRSSDLELRSESQALPRVFSHGCAGVGGRLRSGAGGPVPRGGCLAGARSLAQAAASRRDGEAAEQQVHGGQQGLQEADGAEG